MGLCRPGTTLTVPLRGAARIPHLTIKPRLLQFGKVWVGSSSELPCRLVNESDKLTLRYSITQTASFHCKPKQGEMTPCSCIRLVGPGLRVSNLCISAFCNCREAFAWCEQASLPTSMHMTAGLIPPGEECPLMVTFCPKALGPQQMQLDAQVLTSIGTSIVWSRPIFLSGLACSLDDQAVASDAHAVLSATHKVATGICWQACCCISGSNEAGILSTAIHRLTRSHAEESLDGVCDADCTALGSWGLPEVTRD